MKMRLLPKERKQIESVVSDHISQSHRITFSSAWQAVKSYFKNSDFWHNQDEISQIVKSMVLAVEIRQELLKLL